MLPNIKIIRIQNNLKRVKNAARKRKTDMLMYQNLKHHCNGRSVLMKNKFYFLIDELNSDSKRFFKSRNSTSWVTLVNPKKNAHLFEN